MRPSFFVCVPLMLASTASATVVFGPTAYLSAADSPFQNSFGWQLEDFEDGLLNLPGVTTSTGSAIGPGGNIDSVDGDSGPIDGSGSSGRSYFASNGSAGIRFVFGLAVLPQQVGVVWTDGAGDIVFEAFDANDQLIATINGAHADGSFNSTTGEDRFYGVEHAAGVASIRIRNTSGGIEIDHLQYAFVPAPGAAAIVGFGLLGVARRRRG